MAYYRLYYLGPQSSHFTGMVDFDASGDAAAIEQAEATPSWLDRELWNRGRLVMVFRRLATSFPGLE